MNDDFFILSNYLTKHWNKEFCDIDGYDLLNDILLVFGYNDKDIIKELIREWFSEFKIDDKWFEKVITFRAEDEIIRALNIEITREIDRQIINRLIIGCDVAENNTDQNNYCIAEIDHEGSIEMVDLPVNSNQMDMDYFKTQLHNAMGIPRQFLNNE